ncbi:periplasmic heavy metal sensor [Sneathiella aquimaris]|uniref:periplasmic heavy metal sensor n=1 Tax=Sneathiella aquimaris TaxID=2599305 RepID=UPI00146ECB7F|nr:periplasmic heavy metal sensor [Sneathiella aquimaris]
MTTVKSRWLVIALVLSLGINLAIGGFFFSRTFWHNYKSHSHASFSFDRRAALNQLDNENRNKIKQLWRDQRPAMRDDFRSYRRVKQQVANLMGEDPLDLVAIENAQKELVKRKSRIEQSVYATLFLTAKALPADQRKRFFEEGFNPLNKTQDKAKRKE